MRPGVAIVLEGLELEADGIYTPRIRGSSEQSDEVRLRADIATRDYSDLLDEVARHHSIPVMDRELRLFLEMVPEAGVVADIGGGWGWHWRHLATRRPDVSVVLIDFVRENLRLAARMLRPLVNEQVYLVHGDATALPFGSGLLDACWSVQTLQHVPRFERAVQEVHRVLRPSGHFACYSLNRAMLVEMVYRLCGRSYHISGLRPGAFFLSRASSAQRGLIQRMFASRVTTRYSEILFHPDLRLATGREGSLLGRIDSCLSGRFPLLAPVARQRSYHTAKCP